LRNLVLVGNVRVGMREVGSDEERLQAGWLLGGMAFHRMTMADP
jgi:hypothetical protein